MEKFRCVAFVHAYPGTDWSAGGEVTLHAFLALLVENGWDCSVVLSERSRNNRGDYVLDGVKVYDFTDKLQPNRMIPGADVVMSHLGTAQRASIIAKNCGIPSVHLIHNNHPYTKVMSRHAQFLIYNTEWIMNEFKEEGIPRPPGMVIHPVIDPHDYIPEKKFTGKKKITLINLSYGANGHYDKGAHVFYEMAARFPDEQFLAVKGAYGDQLIRPMSNVEFMDHQFDIRGVYRKTKLLLVPSEQESYGRVAVEAAASGIPSITSTAKGFLETNIGAHRCHFRDYDHWEEAIKEVLQHHKIHSQNALNKSATLWNNSQVELRDFVSQMNSLAIHKRRNPRRG